MAVRIKLNEEQLKIIDDLQRKLGLSSRTETISHILKLMKLGREFPDEQKPAPDKVKDV